MDNIYEVEVTVYDAEGAYSSPLTLKITVIRKVIFVDSKIDNNGDGTSWQNAFSNLQDAIRISENGDEIWLKEGTYHPDIGIGQIEGNRSATFRLKNGISLIGGFIGSETKGDPKGDEYKTILSGRINSNEDHSSYHVIRCIDLNSSKTSIKNLLIRGGIAEQDPNEYSNQLESGSPYHTPYGGGIQIINSKIRFSNCIFEENSALQYRVSNSATGGNPWTYFAGKGGAAFISNSQAAFENCNFQKNFSKNEVVQF